jgi:adenine-specific DNA-methyltransferase
MKTPKPVKSIQHKADNRAHIPSGEEAGYEIGSDRLKDAPGDRDFPLNPVVHRGQDPELYWLEKYKKRELRVPVRSLYRHEHIAPEALIKGLYRVVAEEKPESPELFSVNELFGNALAHEELDKVSDYYTHSDGWTNRLIQGDSLLAMTSLLEREGMAGQVQCCYFDPPYGIKYGSNWQIKLNNLSVTDGNDDSLSGEPEQIKAFRDTWELGIHSYLSYLRDRLLVAKELLHESGSCFVQISDENVHLVRNLMDEIFGSGNFVCSIILKKKGNQKGGKMEPINDFILWYCRDKERAKVRPMFVSKVASEDVTDDFPKIELADGTVRDASTFEPGELLTAFREGAKAFTPDQLTSGWVFKTQIYEVEVGGRPFRPAVGNSWKINEPAMNRLIECRRIHAGAGQIRFKKYSDDFPFTALTNIWADLGGATDKSYVVQTSRKAIQRCILLTTDPGDLVLDPTCGSGTTAYVAEQWGRRWITTDTSRIAINIAKTRLMTATLPFYTLYDTEEGERAVAEGKGKPGQLDSQKARDPKQPLRGHNVRYGFVYKKVPHITLGSIANNEPPAEETLYDQPLEDKKRLRVAGPFTVETLQSYEPISPEELARQREGVEELAAFEDLIFEHLKSAGVKTGDKTEQAVFTRIDRLSSTALHAEGFYQTASGEKKAYLHVGPKFGTVSKQAVTEAIKACRDKRDADWLLILGFAFESGITELSRNFGNFRVSIVRMHDDLLQEGLLKKDKKAASFVTIGEPDIRLHRKNGTATVEIAGLDIYDPIRDEVKSRDVHDIAFWMLDDDYDGSNFVVRQVFFCGGDKNEFDAWKKELSNLAAAAAKKKAEQTLKLQIDDEAFAAAYGHTSRPFAIKPGQKVAVRVVSQFGEETTKILGTKAQ